MATYVVMTSILFRVIFFSATDDFLKANQTFHRFRRVPMPQRRSRFTHEEQADEILGDDWTCVLAHLEEHWPDKTLLEWSLDDLYSVDVWDTFTRDDKKTSAAVLLQDARNVTFPSKRGLGNEPAGLEIFGKLMGKGFDPKPNPEEFATIREFVRNTDNWVRPLCV